LLVRGSDRLFVERQPALGSCKAPPPRSLAFARDRDERSSQYTEKTGSNISQIQPGFGMAEAAGVELFSVLIARKLLILGTATTARKAPLPNPLYVYCTKMLFALESNGHI
jgi:hypothetical protein